MELDDVTMTAAEVVSDKPAPSLIVNDTTYGPPSLKSRAKFFNPSDRTHGGGSVEVHPAFVVHLLETMSAAPSGSVEVSLNTTRTVPVTGSATVFRTPYGVTAI
jgi:hypothetical protein